MHIKTFAREHGYRVRNLNDGHAVPPVKRSKAKCLSTGYIADENRHDAIVCRHGYIDWCDGAWGWCLLLDSVRQLNLLVKKLVASGAVVRQQGDTEAAGVIHPDRFDRLASVIRPLKYGQRGADLSSLHLQG